MRRSDIKPLPSCEELHRLFAYDPLTGKLTWKAHPHPQARRIVPGMEAGTIRTRCHYLAVGIRRDYFYAHRIIWKIMTGNDPIDQIDHIDGDRLNNRWDNLRTATNSSNLWNSKLRADNSSGFKGVARHPSRASPKKWRAIITVSKKVHHIGWFATPEEAGAARAAAALRLHGEYARIS
jgi:hypothetical protein